jgi:hypothetical protein
MSEIVTSKSSLVTRIFLLFNIAFVLSAIVTSKYPFSVNETFCTLQNNYINIYTNGDFELEDPVLHYYRRPQQVQFLNCVDPSSGALITTDVSCEFKDDIVEILIDETCAILAGDIESMIQIERNKQNSNNNT